MSDLTNGFWGWLRRSNKRLMIVGVLGFLLLAAGAGIIVSVALSGGGDSGGSELCLKAEDCISDVVHALNQQDYQALTGFMEWPSGSEDDRAQLEKGLLPFGSDLGASQGDPIELRKPIDVSPDGQSATATVNVDIGDIGAEFRLTMETTGARWRVTGFEIANVEFLRPDSEN